jgi:antirestriction protein ArdC
MTVYEMVTGRIIEQLEQGIIPWDKPWTGTAGAWSRSTGKPYSLINQMLLGEEGEYATFKQIQAAGGKVKKGEHGRAVVFWKMVKVEEEKDGNKEEKLVPVLRYYTVFHINQCEGIEQKYNKEDVALDFNPIQECENVLNGYIERESITLEHSKGDEAYYSPARDLIRLPLPEQFVSIEAYYETAFHEAAHSTGHKDRLNRITRPAAFGSEEYSKEELVAELTSSAILHHMGIETAKTFKNNAAYIQSWIKALKNDVRMIVSASSRADKAFNMIMGIEA